MADLDQRMLERGAIARQRGRLVAAACLLIAGATYGVFSAASGSDQPARQLSAAPLRGAIRAISFHGLTFDVPAAWQYSSPGCSAPTVDTVINPDAGAVMNCAAVPSVPPDPHVTTVLLGSYSKRGPAEMIYRSSRHVLVNGVAATRVSDSVEPYAVFLYGGKQATLLNVPSLDTTIIVVSADRTLADQIFATARPTPIDANGCAGRLSSFTPSGNPPATEILPGSPVAGNYCAYAADLAGGQEVGLESSGLLTSSDIAWLTNGLHEAVPSSTPFSNYGRGRTIVRYTLTYSSGQSRTIAAIAGMDPAPATDGQHAVLVPIEGQGLPGTS